MPPESWCGRLLAKPARPTRSSSSSARLRAACVVAAGDLHREQHVARARVRHGSRLGVWKTKPKSSCGPVTSRPRISTRPWLARVMPATMRKQRGLAAAARAEQRDQLALLGSNRRRLPARRSPARRARGRQSSCRRCRGRRTGACPRQIHFSGAPFPRVASCSRVGLAQSSAVTASRFRSASALSPCAGEGRRECFERERWACSGSGYDPSPGSPR